MAHEYGHNIEYVFSSLNRGPQWIREGFADWVAAKVLHQLGWREYSTTLLSATFQVTQQKASLPTLTEIEDGRGWAVWSAYPNGAVFTYRFAFLAVDKLMAKAGVAGMQKYFANGDFPFCFGTSWNDFYKELDVSLNADSATLKEQVLRRNPALACRDPKIKSEYPVLCKPRTP